MKSYCNTNCSCFNFDQGKHPFVTNLYNQTMQNDDFRKSLWTGCNLQLTLMTIAPHSEIGLEIHREHDQFLYIESGHGTVMMGDCKNCLDRQYHLSQGFGIFIPTNTWHNLINVGNCELKLFSIYAPLQHPFGTIHHTKCDADRAEH